MRAANTLKNTSMTDVAVVIKLFSPFVVKWLGQHLTNMVGGHGVTRTGRDTTTTRREAARLMRRDRICCSSGRLCSS